jgi:hypothetical protein
LHHRTVTDPEFKVLAQEETVTTLFKQTLSDSSASLGYPYCSLIGIASFMR